MEFTKISKHPILQHHTPVRNAIRVLQKIEQSYRDKNVYHWFPEEWHRKKVIALLTNLCKYPPQLPEKNSWEYVFTDIVSETADHLIDIDHYTTRRECFYTLSFVLDQSFPIEEGEIATIFNALSVIIEKRIYLYAAAYN